MKKTVSTLVLLLSIVVSHAYAQTTETTEKADPSVWAEKNKAMIQEMTWNDWLKLDKDFRHPAFMVSKPEQRQSFWLDKLADVMKLDWEKAALAHIRKLYDIIKANPDWFLVGDDGEHEKIQDKVEAFSVEWMGYAAKELKWEQKLIFALVMDLGKVMDTEGNLDVRSSGCSGDSCPME